MAYIRSTKEFVILHQLIQLIFMRKELFLLTAGIFFLHVSKAQNNKESDDRETIEGNGKVVTRDVPVKSFNELKASGVYELRLTQGDKEEVKI